VNSVSLEIEKGEFVAIVGPSGSGKSSLLYMLGMLDRPTSGKMWMDGKDTSLLTEEQLADIRLRKIGFVFQYHFLLPELTALENVTIGMKRLGELTDAEIDQRGMDILDQLGLKEQAHKIPKQLSGGQSQRVAIARALANNPEIIFADEPTGNLDSVSGAKVENILHSLARDTGRTIVVVTHDQEFANTADRIIRIVDGKLV
jgi:lipoprotein-releasing system ATP-binding protein